MPETVTNLDTYVDGYKVISNTETTVTLNNGVTVDKKNCRFLCVDTIEGVTYYRYTED